MILFFIGFFTISEKYDKTTILVSYHFDVSQFFLYVPFIHKTIPKTVFTTVKRMTIGRDKNPLPPRVKL